MTSIERNLRDAEKSVRIIQNLVLAPYWKAERKEQIHYEATVALDRLKALREELAKESTL